MLAAEEDAAHVDVLDTLPGLEWLLEDRGVVAGVDAGVVEEHVDASELVADALVHVGDLALVGDVDLQRQVADRAGADVGAGDLRSLGHEQPRRLGADAAGRSRDHADLALEPSCHQLPPVA